MINVEIFRVAYPEFANETNYPSSAINYWIGVAGIMLPTASWGLPSPTADNPPTTMNDIGVGLFVAHNLVLERQASLAASKGGAPGGGVTGPVTSEGVGGVSRSYDTGAGLNPDAGPWNLTVYGTRFYRMMMMAGRGPVQIGTTGCTPAQPWIGPPVYPNGYY